MNILVDTSVWADHFRASDDRLATFLAAERVLTHPFVIGELALGNLRDRSATIRALRALPASKRVVDRELLILIDAHRLASRGIGLVDAHLLASAVLSGGALLWTRDKRLASAAADLGLLLSE